MIIGSGDIASILKDRDGAIFFASGVSNSSCRVQSEFDREKDLMMDTFSKYGHLDQSLFYFSTLSIDYVNTQYTLHKLKMELIVKATWKNFNIIRIGNITWGKNPNTFINYFRKCIENDIPYQVRDEYKYLVSEKELLLLTDNLPLKGRNHIAVTGRIVKVQDVVKQLLNEKGKVHANNQ